MPPILHYIMGQTINNIDGLICPGHVASVTGSEYFRFISQDYYRPAVVCGFEAEDILTGIHYLVKQISQSEKKELFNLYISCVKSEGKLSKVNTSCQCKDILLGNKTPKECNLFDRICNPFKPYGPCMVYPEGACSIFYRYKENV